MRRRRRQPRSKDKTTDTASEIAAASIRTPKPREICIARNATVAAKNSVAIVILGKHNDICFVVPCAGQDIPLAFSRVIGGAEICIAIAVFYLNVAEFMSQDSVEHASDGI